MTKVMKVLGAASAVALMLPVAAFASIDQKDYGFKVNDKTSDSVQAGDDVEITSTIDVDGASQAEYVRTRFLLNGEVYVSQCDSVGTITDADERSVIKDIETPSDLPEGNYVVNRQFYGEEGFPRAAGCANGGELGSDEDWTGRLFIDDNQGNDNDNAGNDGAGGTGSGSGTSTEDPAITALKAQIAALIAQISGLTGVVAAMAPDAICNQLPTGVSFGSHGAAGLQTFLMNNGETIGYGATGYFGVQTQAALNSFKTKHKCN